ncbi:RNA polymerase sigma-70 factor [Draconibacterium sp. IB214405]|uniref:RNA polymerase sigma factor n=1 Tax=Draconibacterium sp. IB214405 TaxID=3097352 RepID=UPI002A1774D9|nr:RNA polymerase sigma-70 factor [Draconibacterium sp. IB214405]MDX8338685.1 RNA polymerase sigma-70 factor [Draconibacterium sp. IB214405]
MSNTKPNKELIEQLCKDDQVAFYIIYERYFKKLYGFVYRYLKTEDDTDEIVQEVFVKIWESRHKIQKFESFESFLFTVAYNTTISLLRKRASEQKHIEHLFSIQEINQAPTVIDEIHYSELNAKVRSLMNELSERQREIFILSRDEGLSHEQIAQQLGISVNTVKKHVSNALEFLRTRMSNSLTMSTLFITLFFS